MKKLSTRTMLSITTAVGLIFLAGCTPEQQKAVQEKQKVVAEAAKLQSSHQVNIYEQWPSAKTRIDVPVADNLFGSHYVISIDVSTSMGGGCEGQEKMEAAKAAAIDFLNNIPSDASVGLSIFGSQVGMLVPLEFNNHKAVRQAISELHASGGTPMAAAIESSYTSLLKAGSAQLGYGDYNLVVLGDGEPSSSSDTEKWLDYIAQKTPINLTTIGFCATISVLDRVAINYQPASNAAELKAAFATVLAEAAEIDGDDF